MFELKRKLSYLEKALLFDGDGNGIKFNITHVDGTTIFRSAVVLDGEYWLILYYNNAIKAIEEITIQGSSIVDQISFSFNNKSYNGIISTIKEIENNKQLIKKVIKKFKKRKFLINKKEGEMLKKTEEEYVFCEPKVVGKVDLNSYKTTLYRRGNGGFYPKRELFQLEIQRVAKEEFGKNFDDIEEMCFIDSEKLLFKWLNSDKDYYDNWSEVLNDYFNDEVDHGRPADWVMLQIYPQGEFRDVILVCRDSDSSFVKGFFVPSKCQQRFFEEEGGDIEEWYRESVEKEDWFKEWYQED